MFNIITRRALLAYAKSYPKAANALFEWYYELLKSDFANFNELKTVYPNVSIVSDNRVVFNIMGNHFRLVVRISFEYKAIQVKWFGTHAEYDKIDVVTYKIKTNSMELSIIKNEKQYQKFLDWVDEQLDLQPSKKSVAGQKLEVALLLIKSYEDERYPIPFPDPIEAIKVKMEELGIRNKDLVGIIGSKGYISSILNKRKPLTLEIAKIFHKELHIPADVLLS